MVSLLPTAGGGEKPAFRSSVDEASQRKTSTVWPLLYVGFDRADLAGEESRGGGWGLGLRGGVRVGQHDSGHPMWNEQPCRRYLGLREAMFHVIAGEHANAR